MIISTITAVYNGQDSVSDALQSILAQTHCDCELIVIDGASQDGTLSILESFENRISQLVSEPDKGIYDALNKGISRANGDVIGFLHADDLLANPDVLQKISQAFQDTTVDVVYGDLVYVKKDNPNQIVRYWKSGKFSANKLRNGWMPPHPTLYLRRSLYERLGQFDTSYHIAADYDFMLRLLSLKNLNVVYIPEILVKMRLGGVSNRSFKNLILKSSEDYRALRNNQIGGLGALILKNLSKIPQFLSSHRK
jgi:glycosyltransferase